MVIKRVLFLGLIGFMNKNTIKVSSPIARVSGCMAIGLIFFLNYVLKTRIAIISTLKFTSTEDTKYSNLQYTVRTVSSEIFALKKYNENDFDWKI